MARVNLDPILLEKIEGDFLIQLGRVKLRSGAGMRWCLMSGGTCLWCGCVLAKCAVISSGDAGRYVTRVSADYFVVKAQGGDPNVAFAWRLSAHRKRYAGVRLEVVVESDQSRGKISDK